MRLLIDADACPVTDIAVRIAAAHGVACLLLCDTSHVLEKAGAETMVVSKGADSVDFTLVNLLQPGDLVITQDYGLAAMCLARRAVPLSQNGFVYDDSNIGALLEARHEAKKLRNAGKHLKGPPKRTAAQDRAFEALLTEIIKTIG